VAGAEAMEVAIEGEAATVAAGASGDATCGSHLPFVVPMWTMCHLLLRTISYQSMRSMQAKRNGQSDSIPFRLASGLPSHRGQRMKLKMKFGIWALTRSLAQH